MARLQTKRRIGIALFALALVALAALTVHWIVLIWRHESTAVDSEEAALEEAAFRQAQRWGQRAAPPPPGPLPGAPELLVYRITGEPEPRTARLSPRHPQLGLRPSPQAIERLRDRRRRRTAMIVGEGALAVLLLGVCVVMLWRMLASERQRRREIEAFISSVSHELKTPLSGIKALLGSLEMGNVPASQLPQYLEMGLREAHRLEHLVENLLIANRIYRSALQVRLEDVDLHGFLGEFRRHREPLLPEGHAGLRVDEPSARGVWVRADSDKLRVVLENLTDNALKYGEGSEVRIRVLPSDAGAISGDDEVRVVVEDDGAGFEPEQAEALFDGERNHTSSNGTLVHGTGLGLGIARDLARAMGGELCAESPGPGRGSRFTLRLPCVEASAVTTASASKSASASAPVSKSDSKSKSKSKSASASTSVSTSVSKEAS